MFRRLGRITALAASIVVASTVRASQAQTTHQAPPVDWTATRPPLYTDLGTWKHKVTTSVPRAQQYFDQGLRLCYAFNHDEATRAFHEAARLDPKCAMAWWGVAYAAGPNINLPMDAVHGEIASKAIATALTLAPKASALDRAYIEALSTRYSTNFGVSRTGLDSTYATAMGQLAKRFPDDTDAQALYVEARLDLNPWNQWTHDGEPNPGTEAIIADLEAILKAHPEHPGANHFYIHAVEASPHPERAMAAAERLPGLMPGAGHLVHMPAHIWARVARYQDALTANERAVALDEKYIAEQKPDGVYPLMYTNHNIQFIWFASAMQGQSAQSIAAARKIAAGLPPEVVAQMPMVEGIPPMPIATLVRFGRWEEALHEPAPPRSEKYAMGIWQWGRGRAFAALGQPAPAQAALDSVRALGAALPNDFVILLNSGKALLRVAAGSLEGAIAAQDKRWDDATRALEGAVACEDSMHYDEPPTWYFPVRHQLGATLLAASRAADAEAVYRADLARHPENGWSLFGLMQALQAQQKSDEAAAVSARFDKAWAWADVKLQASAY